MPQLNPAAPAIQNPNVNLPQGGTQQQVGEAPQTQVSLISDENISGPAAHYQGQEAHLASAVKSNITLMVTAYEPEKPGFLSRMIDKFFGASDNKAAEGQVERSTSFADRCKAALEKVVNQFKSSSVEEYEYNPVRLQKKEIDQMLVSAADTGNVGLIKEVLKDASRFMKMDARGPGCAFGTCSLRYRRQTNDRGPVGGYPSSRDRAFGGSTTGRQTRVFGISDECRAI